MRRKPLRTRGAGPNASRVASAGWVLAVTLLICGADAYGMTCSIERGSQDLPGIEVVEFMRLGEEANGDSILFGSISAIAVGGTGRVFVGERQDPKVYVFSEEGRLLTALGSRGDAPGEYNAISGIYPGPADSLYVYDNWDLDLTVYEPQQYRFVYSLPIQKGGPGSARELLGITSESLVFSYGRSTGTGTENQRRWSDVRLVDWNGKIISESLLTVEQGEYFLTVTPEFQRNEALPFGRSSTIRMSSDHALYSGWNDASDIKVVSLDGTALHEFTYPRRPRSVTPEDRRAALARSSNEMRKRLAAGDLHDTWPIYETFVVDDRGAVWLKLVENDEDEWTSWLVIDSNGRATGTAVLPATFDLSVVQAGHIYGSGRNESGDPIVVGYEILD